VRGKYDGEIGGIRWTREPRLVLSGNSNSSSSSSSSMRRRIAGRLGANCFLCPCFEPPAHSRFDSARRPNRLYPTVRERKIKGDPLW
jgi:hypothetical protein